MKYLIFLLLLTGCDLSTDHERRMSLIMSSAEGCFKDGGSEYHRGASGGSSHAVCVYKK